jgi:hypothetical protein
VLRKVFLEWNAISMDADDVRYHTGFVMDIFMMGNEHENMINIGVMAITSPRLREEMWTSTNEVRFVGTKTPSVKHSTHPMGVMMGKTVDLTHLLLTREVLYVTWSVSANYYIILSICHSFEYTIENPASRFGSKPRAAAGAKTDSAVTPRLLDRLCLNCL